MEVTKQKRTLFEWQPEETVSSGLTPLLVPIGEEGASAAPHREDEDDEAVVGHETALPAPLSSQPTAEILEADRAARTEHRAPREACIQGHGRNADHMRLAAEQDHLIDTVSVNNAYSAQRVQTAELV